MVDHADDAERILSRLAFTDEKWKALALLQAAQVHATLALVAELKLQRQPNNDLGRIYGSSSCPCSAHSEPLEAGKW